MSLTTLIFDVDGTLADTERDGHRAAYNKTFAQAGLDWVWSTELYEELLQVTGGKERMAFYVSRYRPDFQQDSNFSSLIADLYTKKTKLFAELVANHGIPLRPGIMRLLQEAKSEGLRLAIATTTSPHNVTALLDANLGEEGRDWFACIGAGDIVPKKKPAPDIYFYVMEQLGVSPKECLVFEDSDNGLRAALAANLSVLVTANDYTRHQDFTGAKLVVDHLGDPGMPCQVLQGDPLEIDWVTVSTLRRLVR